MRDDFTQATKDVLARRVNYLCSNPDCPVATVGPHTEASKSVNKGVAAHITAASEGGKRYDPSLTSEQRSSPENGIWLCQNCAKLIDSDESRFPTDLLHAWKTIAESRVNQSITANTALLSNETSDLRIRASYAGGHQKYHIHLSLFNAAQTPIYLGGWFAKWGPENTESMTSSLSCVRGKLPFRLQSQDRYEITIDLGGRGYSDLTMVGIVDGNNRYWDATGTDIRTITQHAERYSALYPQRDTTELEQKYRDSEIEITCSVISLPNNKKELHVKFLNKSTTPIQLRGGDLAWEYDPPRSSSPDTGSKPHVAEIGGNISLMPKFDLKMAVEPGADVIFVPPPDLAGILVETILGDVPDDAIKIQIYTDTKLMWVAHGDEVPGCVKEFAKSLVPAAD